MRARLERTQVWWYLAAGVLGLAIGSLIPDADRWTSPLVWPALAVLLFATFSQLPLRRIAEAFADTRFLLAALVGNFVLVPLAVWALVQLVPDHALQLGLLLVLLVPCTDWFITFAQLGRGDAARATALTPITLVLQLLLLPVYLWLVADADLTVIGTAHLLPALAVVLGPLVAAAVTERWLRGRTGTRVREGLGAWPVPVLALVIALVAAGHVGSAGAALSVLPLVAAIAVIYLVVALVMAVVLTRALRLPAAAGRTLAFSLGTRNSFLVLPFALALPSGWELAAVAVVMQSLIELFGMIVYIRAVPALLPDRPGR